MAALNGVNYCLNLMGFITHNNRHRIRDDGLSTYEDFCNVTDRDISEMSEAFAKRTNAEGKIVFGHGRTKKLKGFMHWIHDKYRCNDPINHIDFTLEAMNESLDHAAARLAEKEQIETVSKAAKPEKFSKESQWPSFYLAFKNYLSSILGVFDVRYTTSYVRLIHLYQVKSIRHLMTVLLQELP